MRTAVAVLMLMSAGCAISDNIPWVGDQFPSQEKENARIQRQMIVFQHTHKPAWKSLCDAGKFKSALAYIQANKDEMGDANANELTEDTQKECRSYLNERLSRFRRYLGDVRSQGE